MQQLLASVGGNAHALDTIYFWSNQKRQRGISSATSWCVPLLAFSRTSCTPSTGVVSGLLLHATCLTVTFAGWRTTHYVRCR
jgi:hypothetical protein